MLAPARPVTSPFAHSTERSADVVPIHHSNDGDQHVAGSLGGYRSLRGHDDLQAENLYLRREVQERLGPGVIVGRSTAIQRVLEQARQVAATDSTVLLLGETGTGKELIATQIHEQSSRRGRVMVRINCAAIPSTLIESELFGREKGAFTGALARQIGRFELADHSTIFLDEIGDLPVDTQVKLLRVLEERQIERLGSPKAVGVDVRIIAATHRNLERRITEDAFRQDLYYRLNVFPIEVPPLRDRTEDIPLLVWRFVDEFSKSFGKRVEAIPRDNMDALQRYSWPGNIRELRNVVERAMIVAVGHNLTIPIPAQPAVGAQTQREADGRREGARPQRRRRMPLAHPRRRRRRGAAWTSADDARDTYGQAWDQAPGAGMQRAYPHLTSIRACRRFGRARFVASERRRLRYTGGPLRHRRIRGSPFVVRSLVSQK